MSAQEKKQSYDTRKTHSSNNIESHSYTLNGTINVDTGTIILRTDLADTFYPTPQTIKEARIENGHFSFSGIMSYPLPYTLRIGSTYLSSSFLIDEGTQTIVCDKDSVRVVPKVNNKSMKESRELYRTAFTEYNTEYYRVDSEYYSLRREYGKIFPDSIKEKRDLQTSHLNRVYYNLLKKYVKKHPDSYVAFWHLIDGSRLRYDPVYDTIYNLFSDHIKNTPTGKVFKEGLNAAKALQVGHKFPSLSLLNQQLSSEKIPLATNAHKYTLVDFWFSHCPPCLGQFPKFKEIYKKYERGSLEIIGISVDKTKYISDWKKVIADKELVWPQYLDENGVLAESFLIETFPRNYLLDKNNVIIKKDVQPEELEKMLSE